MIKFIFFFFFKLLLLIIYIIIYILIFFFFFIFEIIKRFLFFIKFYILIISNKNNFNLYFKICSWNWIIIIGKYYINIDIIYDEDNSIKIKYHLSLYNILFWLDYYYRNFPWKISNYINNLKIIIYIKNIYNYIYKKFIKLYKIFHINNIKKKWIAIKIEIIYLSKRRLKFYIWRNKEWKKKIINKYNNIINYYKNFSLRKIFWKRFLDIEHKKNIKKKKKKINIVINYIPLYKQWWICFQLTWFINMKINMCKYFSYIFFYIFILIFIYIIYLLNIFNLFIYLLYIQHYILIKTNNIIIILYWNIIILFILYLLFKLFKNIYIFSFKISLKIGFIDYDNFLVNLDKNKLIFNKYKYININILIYLYLLNIIILTFHDKMNLYIFLDNNINYLIIKIIKFLNIIILCDINYIYYLNYFIFIILIYNILYYYLNLYFHIISNNKIILKKIIVYIKKIWFFITNYFINIYNNILWLNKNNKIQLKIIIIVIFLIIINIIIIIIICLKLIN
jgi:hypothetical protein